MAEEDGDVWTGGDLSEGSGVLTGISPESPQNGEEKSLTGLSGLADDSSAPKDPGLQITPSSNTEEDRKGSTVHGASANFINAIIGAGIVGLPFALRESGFIAGVPMVLLVAWTAYMSTGVIISLGLREGVSTYEDLAAKALGRFGFVLINVCNAAFAAGAQLAYLVITGDTISVVLTHWADPSSDDVGDATGPSTDRVDPSLRRGMIALFATIAMLPLSLLRTMTALERWSGLSLFAVLIIIIFVFTRLLTGAGEGSLTPTSNEEKQITGISPRILPGIAVASFAFVTHHNAFIVHNSLQEVTLIAWYKLAKIAIGVSAIASILLAVTGYLTFRNVTQGNATDEFANAVRLLYALTMVLTFPLEMMVTRYCIYSALFRGSNATPTSSSSAVMTAGKEEGDIELVSRGNTDDTEARVVEATNLGRQEVRKGTLGVVWGVIRGVCGPDDEGNPHELPLAWHLGLTFGIWIVILGVALAVDDLGIVLEITGGVAASLIGYIIPGYLLLRLSHVSVVNAFQTCDRSGMLVIGQSAYLILLGLAAMIITLVLTIQEGVRAIHGHKTEDVG